jgi:hypothetical protein
MVLRFRVVSSDCSGGTFEGRCENFSDTGIFFTAVRQMGAGGSDPDVFYNSGRGYGNPSEAGALPWGNHTRAPENPREWAARVCRAQRSLGAGKSRAPLKPLIIMVPVRPRRSQKRREPRCEIDTWGTLCASLSAPIVDKFAWRAAAKRATPPAARYGAATVKVIFDTLTLSKRSLARTAMVCSPAERSATGKL